MGTDTQSTVYAAELKGILLALQILIANCSPEHHHFAILTDNQSALNALQNPGNTSGQSILVELLQIFDQATTAGLTVYFRWIPAHRGILGNDIADVTAREAANLPTTTDIAKQDTTPTLLTTAKGTINTALHQDWNFVWIHAKYGRALYDLGRKPDKKSLRLYRNLPRPISSVFT